MSPRFLRQGIGTGLLGRTAKGVGAAHSLTIPELKQLMDEANRSGVGAPASGVAFANPTATAKDTAVNGTAATAMRSDAAPAVQKASSSQFGIVKVDGTTIIETGGVISTNGGSGGEPLPFSPPLAASFTSIIQEVGRTITLTDQPEGCRLTISGWPGGAADQWTAPQQVAPATPWTLKVRVRAPYFSPFGQGGIVLSDGSGKLVTWGFNFGNGTPVLATAYWSASNSFSSGPFNMAFFPTDCVLILTDDGTNLICAISMTGDPGDAIIMGSLSRTAWFASGPTHVGWGINPHTGIGSGLGPYAGTCLAYSV